MYQQVTPAGGELHTSWLHPTTGPGTGTAAHAGTAAVAA